MYYNFWKQYQSIVTPDIEVQFDTRLHNVIMKLELFFSKLVTKEIIGENIKFYLAGSCIKSDTFRDLDLIFPVKTEREVVNEVLDKHYFEYENNSYTYKFEDDIFQLVFREKFENASLSYLVDGFDFDSTKIAFECILTTKTKKIEVINTDIRIEFINYINTKVNNLSTISVNPFVSLQRAIHFLKRGDEVPYSVFLDVCSSIADIKIKENENIEKHFNRLQGDPKKLKNIKKAITHFIKEKEEELGKE
ncbi:MAG: hypothetical protein ACNI3C_02195 [Candidatus Marinarcus sp.]|uniref:hypothetical protein n=1 Tax=Candidatus Marinarcus sp. TaxID=3100987 RepID=UPI003B009EB0